MRCESTSGQRLGPTLEKTGERMNNGTEIIDETVIEVYKSKESLELFDCGSSWSVMNRINLSPHPSGYCSYRCDNQGTAIKTDGSNIYRL